MSQKTKDIIFYVVAGLFVALALITLVITATAGSIPVWLAIVLAVVETAFFISGTIVWSKTLKLEEEKEAAKIAAFEALEDEQVVEEKPVEKKTSKGTTKKATKAEEVK